MEASPAGLVVVLAGPVAAGARAPRRTITRGLISAWARPLRPGGLLMVLRPGELGQHRTSHGHAGVVSTAREAGLSYLQHIVLVHVPAAEGDALVQRSGHLLAHCRGRVVAEASHHLVIDLDLLSRTIQLAEDDALVDQRSGDAQAEGRSGLR